MKLTDKQIEEIADELEAGMSCFYNLKTGEIKIILDFDNWIYTDEEPWEEDIKELDENWCDYFQFEGMNSRDSFKIMEDFTENVDDNKTRERLIKALNKSKPFSNFKWQIDNSGEYRKAWFAFRKARFIDWVKEQINAYNLNKAK
ncbi:MAG: UPF0158 family protein [Bacteroidales bacterium]|nr:UPF0158 family protein [Bacteroidales bacterium]